MTNNARPISNLYACTVPSGNDKLVVVGNTSGTPNNFLLSITSIFGSSQANVNVPNGYYVSTNTLILRFHNSPAHSTDGGYPNNSIWFDSSYIYCVQANGYIMRAALNSF